VRKYLPGNWKRLSFASAEEIHEVSDYTKGAIAPVGLPENIPVIFDESIARCTKVNISSGDHMAGLELDPKDLIHITDAIIAPIAEKETI
ncbi:MAG: YbaK/EbsC family protein, partial [Anaerolineales bacterium]|jgi:prolyl-tRNA editing enzyme YbaK/EbsC (Cys-tRNA(Pro) deacylase)